ncbi:MAG TPA: hypothetical protein DDZ80_22025 [Cyanobacteria bacterium UBA8803]|nr:hypothetical protein [Cyanobacteria bacterium UBA9273]HBL61009.1 hypothetical protein [Cyanobacteria bacterium UBA8803]
MFNSTVARNLLVTTLLLTMVSLGLAEVHENQATPAQQYRFDQIERGIKMVGVAKAQQLRYR